MMAPPLAGSPRVQGHRDYVIKTLLHGMTGPLAGQTYTQVMLPMGAQNDQWIANVASFIRNEFGNTAAFISPAEVARVRAATAQPQDDVDVSRARGHAAAAAAGRSDVEGDGQPQRRACRERADTGGVDDWRAAGAGHVVPGRAAAGGDDHRGAVRRRRARRRWPWPRRPRCTSASRRRPARWPAAPARRRTPAGRTPAAAPAAPQRGAAPGGGRGGGSPFGSFPIGYKIQLSMDGKTWSAPVAAGQRLAGDHDRHLPAGAGQVRQGDPDRDRGRRAGLVSAEFPRLRGGECAGALTRVARGFACYGGDGGNGFNHGDTELNSVGDARRLSRRVDQQTGRVAGRTAGEWHRESGTTQSTPCVARCFALCRSLDAARASRGATGPPCVSVLRVFYEAAAPVKLVDRSRVLFRVSGPYHRTKCRQPGRTCGELRHPSMRARRGDVVAGT